ncbi:hypothetical protein CB082_16760 [Salmonella enterica subsp. enterica serovar Altona]|uniref:RHS repeat protein n=2 Tax=Salmonella enterica TaxID=28901 RepID=A0A616EJ60_SALER|nr:hypothetical protein [Salmonella enterica]EBP3657808.1 hypothetical protein [Salmonella enterica subsp. enterica]ECD4598935.1 hypothetical protein [Salmonella enterica subsp. enterica serovar Waycross]EDA6661817.1 hypothetical protein [Salmonella enterica subsp. enterica serovar Muenster]EDE1803298.1 hypothetical protein [Salmonella enterica subsp. enterica serovar Enteritidis]EDS5541972.1 hypothetical protein [Salmonella enterica subsp. enterica serovar Uganda]
MTEKYAYSGQDELLKKRHSRQGVTDYFYDTTGRITACRNEAYLDSWQYDVGKFHLIVQKVSSHQMPRIFLNLVRLILMIQKLDGQKLVKGKSLFGIDSKVVRQMVLVLFIGMVLQMALILKADRGQ